MIQNKISAYSIICNSKEIVKKGKIRSLQKLLDIRHHGKFCFMEKDINFILMVKQHVINNSIF